MQALVKHIPHTHELLSRSISSMASLLNQAARHALNYQNRRTTPALLCQFLTLFLRKTELFTLHQHFQTLSLCNRHNNHIRNTTDLSITQNVIAFSMHSRRGKAEVCRVANIESNCRMRSMKSVVTLMRFNTLS